MSAIPASSDAPPVGGGVPEVLFAFSLGWNLNTLFYTWLTAGRRSDREPRRRELLAPEEMGREFGARITLAKVEADLRRVWLALDPNRDCPDLSYLHAELDNETLTHDDLVDHVTSLHRKLLILLASAEDFRQLKAYRLGLLLSEFAHMPNGQDPGALVRALARAQAHHTESGDICALRLAADWLTDLRSAFPEHSAQAVRTAVLSLQGWLDSPCILDPGAKKRPMNWESHSDCATVSWFMHREGKRWQSVLSGERNGLDLLTRDNYLDAARGWVSSLRTLTLAFCRRFWITSLTMIGLVVSAGLAIVLMHAGPTMIGVLLTIIGALGFTWRSASAGLGKVVRQAQNPLWEREVEAAIADALNWPVPDPEEMAASRAANLAAIFVRSNAHTAAGTPTRTAFAVAAQKSRTD